MSHSLNNPSTAPRDYGATASTSSSTTIVAAAVPDVNFSSFSPTEFVSLSQDIAHNINAVNSSCKQLEKMHKIIGTPRDQLAIRTKIHNINAKTNTRIESTSKDLRRLTLVVQRSDKQQKLQSEKLLNEFQAVVERYATVQRQVSTAMKRTIVQSQQGIMQDEEQSSSSTMDRAELLQRQQQIDAGLKFEHDMLVDRERQLRQIEADILDVNTIMRTLGNMVQGQADHVDRIETSIENAATEVELGRDELAKASQHHRSYRRKILIILAIAVIIGLIVTGIIVNKITS